MVAKFTKCCRKNTYDILEVRLTGLSENICRRVLGRHFEELCCPPLPWGFSTFYPFSLWERERKRERYYLSLSGLRFSRNKKRGSPLFNRIQRGKSPTFTGIVQ
jgi:hypothetical protein